MTTRNHRRRKKKQGKTVAIRLLPEIGSNGVNMKPLPTQTGYPIKIFSVNSGPQIQGSVTAFRTALGTWKVRGHEYESSQIEVWGKTFVIGPEFGQLLALRMLGFNAEFMKNIKARTPKDQGDG